MRVTCALLNRRQVLSRGTLTTCVAKRQPRRTAKLPRSFPYPFRHFCEACGSGCSLVFCEECDGEGIVLTKPGGAGVPFRIGNARCKVCGGSGAVPCPLCGGCEISLPPPDPENGPKVPPAVDDHLSIYEWLAQFGG